MVNSQWKSLSLSLENLNESFKALIFWFKIQPNKKLVFIPREGTIGLWTKELKIALRWWWWTVMVYPLLWTLTQDQKKALVRKWPGFWMGAETRNAALHTTRPKIKSAILAFTKSSNHGMKLWVLLAQGAWPGSSPALVGRIVIKRPQALETKWNPEVTAEQIKCHKMHEQVHGPRSTRCSKRNPKAEKIRWQVWNHSIFRAVSSLPFISASSPPLTL